MKKTFLLCAGALVALASIAAYGSGQTAQQMKPATASEAGAQSGFNQLKTLVGTWEGTAPDGKPTRVTYEFASNGTALLERLHNGEESEMITMYSADGDRLAMTHFCSANNQPQMRTGSITGPVKQFSFSLVHVGNLASPAAGHMHHLTLTLPDHDHLTQEWTWQQDGKLSTDVFQFTRKT